MIFFFSSRRRPTRSKRDWSSDVCSSDLGYSIGVNYPPNWADHTASLRENDTTVMEPNMTFHLMLGMWMEGWGFELSDTFRVTETGHEVLADFPRQLFVKE